jgi:hypothetical protein
VRRVAAVMLAALSCSKPQPKADSVAAEAPAAGASAAGLTSTQAAPVSQAPRDDTPAKTASRSTGSASTTGTSNTSQTRTRPSVGDVIIGRVNEHGFDPVTFLAITPASGAQIRISGSQIAALGNVKGADVWAQGRQDADGFVVDTFEVRQVNDRPAEDGIVSVAGTTVTVRTARATLTYPDAPTALRDAAGARVWITPPVAGQAPSFGIIRTSTKQLRR